jgi:hypothetical protein
MSEAFWQNEANEWEVKPFGRTKPISGRECLPRSGRARHQCRRVPRGGRDGPPCCVFEPKVIHTLRPGAQKDDAAGLIARA